MERPLISVERLLVIRYQIQEEGTFNRHPHLSLKTVLKSSGRFRAFNTKTIISTV